VRSRELACIVAISLCTMVSTAWAQAPDSAWNHSFEVTSATFSNGGTLPLNTVWNQCTAYPGGLDQSPQLSWKNAPRGTRSFVVVTYDVTASFTHWGMYNISSKLNSLPLNAGVAGSSFGVQVSNDFGDISYDGPCPPTTLNPTTHQYVFTVYALDVVLPKLPNFGDFAPGAEQLYHALLAAARGGHILDSASITGYFPNK